MKIPILSILVPIYGVEKYIERCARSLFCYSSDEVEYIFVNDGTEDGSIQILLDVVSEFPNIKNYIHIIEHDHNKGLAYSRLTGIKASKGKYIWCVDSDDFISNDAIRTILHELHYNPDLLMFNYYTYDGNKTLRHNREKLSVDSILCSKVPPMIWCNIYKKDIYIQNDIFPIAGLNYSEDYILNSRLFTKVRIIHFTSKPLYYYNISNISSYTSNISTKSLEEALKGVLMVVKYYKTEQLLKKHSLSLIFALFVRYWDLKAKDKDNKLLVKFRKVTIEYFPLYGRFFFSLEDCKLSIFSRVILKTYRKFII